MLVAAAVCPHPPLLIPQAMGAGGETRDGVIGEVLAACDAAVAALAAARPELTVVVGAADKGAPAAAAYDGSAAGSLAGYGVRFSTGPGDPVLPLSVTVGSWLVRRSAAPPERLLLRAVARNTPVAQCLRLGAEIARQAPRVAVLAMGDGPGRRAAGAERAADPAADAYDAGLSAALAEADPARLARLAPSLDDELLVAGRAAWQVLAGAADGQRLRGHLRCAVTQYEVSYLVASWEAAGG
ncbi:MAG TPA: hypothetical protein VMF87_36060 [Streptosporangiaceae bacterium]|nr:hypothetical protein [Streptosporangiaceae bacterium]